MDKFVIQQKRKIVTDEDHVELEKNRKRLKKGSVKTYKPDQLHPKSETKTEVTKIPLLKKLTADGLDCDYFRLYTKQEADEKFRQCEDNLVFNSARESRIQVFGKWHEIRRKQVNVSASKF